MAGTPGPEDFVLQRQAEADPFVRAYLELAGDVVFTLDEFGRIASANPRMAELFGLPTEALLNRYFVDFAPREDRESISGALRRARVGDAIEPFDIRVPGRGDRPERTYSVRSRGIRDGSGFLGTLHIARDATAERRTEREMLEWADNALREAQRVGTLGILAAGVAHDFKNILTAILSNASLAEAELGPGSAAAPHIARIREAALRAGDLTEQMLSYSGQGERTDELLDLNTLVDGMADLVRASIRRNISVTMQLEPDLPPIRGDATQLRQMLMNLLLNAAEAIDGQGNITIRTFSGTLEPDGLATASLQRGLRPGTTVFVEIEDDGQGMDAETARRMFEPFFTTKQTGLGLGLGAIPGILEAHKGAAWVRSTPGEGTIVRVGLPDAVREDSAGRRLVLVVDDEKSVVDVTSRAVRSFGFEVATAGNGEDAVARLRERTDEVACVLLDYSMPGSDGGDLLGRLRALDPGVPIILLSGYAIEDVASALQGRDGVAFLQKPYTVEGLREAVSATARA